MLSKISLQPYTQNTITNVEKLLDEIRTVRNRGFAVDNEEFQEGVRCIAAPIYDYRGQMIAAISISAPTSVLQPNKDEENAQKVVETAKKISHRLGYVEDKKDYQRKEKEEDGKGTGT